MISRAIERQDRSADSRKMRANLSIMTGIGIYAKLLRGNGDGICVSRRESKCGRIKTESLRDPAKAMKLEGGMAMGGLIYYSPP